MSKSDAPFELTAKWRRAELVHDMCSEYSIAEVGRLLFLSQAHVEDALRYFDKHASRVAQMRSDALVNNPTCDVCGALSAYVNKQGEHRCYACFAEQRHA